MSALYIHVPFCKTRCNYCDFYKSTSRAETEVYIEALEREMEYRHAYFGSDPVETIFFGGGTPSLYRPATLQRLIDKARSLWRVAPSAEITAEMNPDDITAPFLDELAATDINRISFGVQSFVDRDLRLLGRRHDARQAAEAIRHVQERGFDNISLDLIFGIPGMSAVEWEGNVRQAAALGIRHLSAYCLTIAEGTPFGKMVDAGKLVTASDETCEEQFLLCHRILADHGFHHYEISNYARGEAFRSRHNWAYWNGTPYLGLGPSAHSYDGDLRIHAVDDLGQYLRLAGTEHIYETERLSPADKYNEYIMTALRTDRGVSRAALARRFGPQGVQHFEASAEQHIRTGDIIREATGYRIPPEKCMISNRIISDLFYIEA